MSEKNLVLRTVYMDPDIDDKLRDQAYAGRRSKNDLVRMYIKMGMEAAALGAAPGKPVVTQKINKAVDSGAGAKSRSTVRSKSLSPKRPKSVAVGVLQQNRSGSGVTRVASAKRATPAKKAAPKRAAA
ncbi:UNVERIFIED_ORG: hypothetical protein J2Y81_008091 [Paraburkholderia sediminicola]|nr:hypothetical protein [Paraburkholderia sediminicola]